MAIAPWITEEDKAAVRAVLDAGDLMSGARVAEFERMLADYFGKRHAVCVASGTAALECALVADDDGTDATHSHGYIALVHAMRAAGRMPYGMGVGVGTDVLGELYSVYGRVHDCSHRFTRDAARADLSCFSLNANKFIGCVGGVVVTNDSAAAATMRQYRNHGRDGGPEIFRDGRNLRMGEMNAALGISQLKRIDEIMARRKQVADWYTKLVGAPATGDGMFMYAVRCSVPRESGRTLADFRLFDTATFEDRCVWLLPNTPLMTRGDVDQQVSVCTL